MDGKLNYGMTIDTSQLKADVRRAAAIFTNLEAEIERISNSIDNSVNTSGSNTRKISQDTTKEIQRQSRNAEEAVKGISSTAERETSGIMGYFRNIGAYIAATFSTAALTGFARSIISVRGEIESLETSFKTLAGEQAGGKLFADIKQFATTTPMMMQDLAKGAQTLLAFNTPANEVMNTLKQLGDVSMGDSQKFNSLVLAFAQMSSAGKLMGQDLMQMINAGFNPLAEISAKTGKSIGVLKDEMSKGKISVDMVKEAFASATSEGGKFYQMLETQSKTINGAISNLQGAWDDMLNSIGEQMQGSLVNGISLLQSVLQNWQEYVRVLMGVVAAYGTYKAVLMSTMVVEKARNIGESIRLIAMFRKELGLVTATQQAFNIAASANPYGALAAVLGVIVGLLVNFNSETSKAEESQKRLSQSSSDIEGKLTKETQRINEQFAVLTKAKRGSEEWKKAKDNIVKNYGQYLQGIDKEIDKVGNLKSAYEKLTQAVQTSIAERGLASLQESNLTALGEDMDKALKSVQEGLQKAPEGKRQQLLNEVRDYIMTGTGMVEGTFVADLKKAGGTLWQNIRKARQTQTANLNAEAQYRERFGFKGEVKKQQDSEESKTATDATITTDKERQNLHKQQQAYLELLDKQTTERVRASEDAEFQIEQARIDKMSDSTDKIIAQIQLNEQKELKEAERSLEDYKAKQAQAAKAIFEADPANEGKTWGGLGVYIDPAVVEANQAAVSQIIAKYAKQRSEAKQAELNDMNDYLAKYGNYEQRRAAIIAQYGVKMSKATTEGQKNSLTAEMTQALADLDSEANKSTNSVTRLFDDMAKRSIADLRSLATAGKQALEFLTAGAWNDAKGKELGITKEQFALWSKSPEQLQKIRKAIEEIEQAADALETPLNKISQGLKDIFSTETGKFLEGLKSTLSGLSDMTNAVSFVSTSFNSLGDALGSGPLSGIGDVASELSNIGTSIQSGAQAGAVFGPWGAAAGAALGAVTSVTSAISKWIDAKHERRIKRLQEQVDALSKAYDNLSESVDKAFSGNAVKMYEQQNALLKQQKILIQKQIQEEEAKKKTDKDRIKQWKEQLEEIDKMIKDNEENAINAIFGSDIKSAIEQFADAYANAFNKGNSRAKASKDLVKEMIASMVREAIKADFTAPMEIIRQKLLQFWSDGIISDAESAAIEQMVNDAMKQADSRYQWATKYLSSSTDQSTTSKGFETMSQDTADELNGRFASLQMNTEIIKTSLSDVAANIAASRASLSGINLNIADIRTLSIQAVSQLESIAKNTRPISEMSDKLDKIEKNTRNI